MAVIIESGAPDASTAAAIASLGLPSPEGIPDGVTALPARVVQGIIGLSGLITAIVWLVSLRAR